MSRLSPLVVLILVTALTYAYGHHSWSWLAGPIAGFFVWAFDRRAHEPAEPSAEPAPVD